MARMQRSIRLALNAEGKDVADFTEAKTAIYRYVEPQPDGTLYVVDDLVYDPATAPPELNTAYALFGFHTHSGNHVNKGVTGPTPFTREEMLAHIDEYRQMMAEGGWSNRKGEATAGAAIFIEAFARIRSAADGGDLEDYRARIKAAWETWDDAAKDAIRTDAAVKAEVAKIRAERAAEKGKAGPSDKVAALTF